MAGVLTLATGCLLFNTSPTARFVATPMAGVAPLTVSFDASDSSDPDGHLVSYQWNFGDGTTGSGETEIHTYETSGKYTVRLTVTDDKGSKDSESRTIQVTDDTPPTDNTPPTASFTATPSSGIVPLTVSFDASNSSDPDGEIESYAWEFGDGATGSGVTVTHTYVDPGIYSVKLTVTDDKGAEDQITGTIVLEERAPICCCLWRLTSAYREPSQERSQLV